MSDIGAAAAALAQHRAKLRGIAWMLVTGLFFVAVTGIVRHLGSDMDAIQAAFIRYVFGLIMISPVFLRTQPGSFTPRNLRLHMIRGLAHGCGVMLWFFAMARIPIAQVTAIGFTAPIFITLGAALFLGERLQARRIGAVLIGFGGTLVILRPGLQHIPLGALAQLAAAPLFAASYLIAKKLTGTQSSSSIVAYLSVFVTIVLLPPAIMVWRTPTYEELFWLAATAFCATCGHYTMTRAMQAAPITVIQPFSFLQLVWATLLGLYAFGEEPDFWTWIGAGIIVASATYIAHRETVRRGRAEPKPGPH
jgi:drug/metabolite transporter (DMT)-like permease